MKLLYDHSIFRLQRYGGISRYFYELITRLSSQKDTGINLFEGFHINEYGLSGQKNNFNAYRGFKVPEIKYAGYTFEIINKLWFNQVYSKSDFDIYHPTYYRKDLHKFKKKPVVLTVHDMIHELYSSQFWNSKWVIESKKISIDVADVIICVSENTKKDLIRIYDVPENKIKVVYHASSMQLSEVSTASEAGCNIKKPYILYVGDRRKYKNFSLLLDAYIDNFSNKFDLVCFGGGGFNKNELKIIRKSNLSKNIIHLNGQDKLLASLYKNAFCFVFPSLYEGFGIPLLEAMAMGCPVIASNTSSIPEVAGKAALLFDPISKGSLVDAIGILEKSESKKKELIRLGFEREKKFNWDKAISETLDIYRSIL
ncbi:MAG: glycosyltransferase family 4 protein [Candidatus Methanoperedens sp.]|nr:glycosyltransferase family 4 protein [Candidatus Methanoperedens sp.]